MSLREELAKQLKFDHTHPDMDQSYMDQADKIIKLVEKRIDEIPPASSTQRFKSINDTSQVMAYVRGYEDACEKIMELLK
jgi:hypothetical protein